MNHSLKSPAVYLNKSLKILRPSLKKALVTLMKTYSVSKPTLKSVPTNKLEKKR